MTAALAWDADLIARYDRAGPRYTSYPTAVQFHDGIGPFDLLGALRLSRQAGRPLSLYLHVPFCANICYYCACNKVITKDRSRSAAYLDALRQEMILTSRHLDGAQRVEQLHLGGGTPTFLNPMQLRELMADLRRHFTLADSDRGDYSIEIDPREADWSTMGLLRELGFNRVSFGVQDLDLQVQLAINRLQPFDDTRTLVEAARALDYRSINLDLIYGLPRQTPATFAHTVERVLELQPHRLSVFNYAHLPQRFPPQRRIEASELPDPAAKLEMLQRTVEQLLGAGYRYIGMDHFALPDDDLAIAQEDGTLQRNFQGYTTHGHCDLLGLGVSAISQIGEVLCQNTPDLARYQERLGQSELAVARGLRRSRDDRIRGAVIAQLICHFQLDFAAIERSCELDFRHYFADAWPQLEAMAADGLIRLDARGLQVLAPGRLLIRALCMLFDRYLPGDDNQRFSRVI